MHVALPEPTPKAITCSYSEFSQTRYDLLNSANNPKLKKQFKRVESFINFTNVEMRLKFRDGLCVTLPAWNSNLTAAAYGTQLYPHIFNAVNDQRIMRFQEHDIVSTGLNDLQVRVDMPDTLLHEQGNVDKYSHLSSAIGVPINEEQIDRLSIKPNTSDKYNRLKGIGEWFTAITLGDVQENSYGRYVEDWDVVIWIPNPRSDVLIRDIEIIHPFGGVDRQRILENRYKGRIVGNINVGYHYVTKRPLYHELWVVNGSQIYPLRYDMCSDLEEGIYVHVAEADYGPLAHDTDAQHYSVEDAIAKLPIYTSIKDARDAVKLIPNLVTVRESIVKVETEALKEVTKLKEDNEKLKMDVQKLKYDALSLDKKEALSEQQAKLNERKDRRSTIMDFFKSIPSVGNALLLLIAGMIKIIKLI